MRDPKAGQELDEGKERREGGRMGEETRSHMTVPNITKSDKTVGPAVRA